MAHVVTKAQRRGAGEEAMQRMWVQGHGDVGHVSIVMLFCPHHASSPLRLVVGPNGPSRERVAVSVGKEG